MGWGVAVAAPAGVCKICGAEAPLFGVLDFNRNCRERVGSFLPLAGVPVYYRRCVKCGFVFTEFCDGWTRGDFLDRIYNDAYLAVDPEYAEDRPRRSAEALAEFFPRREGIRLLDYGGGNGRLAELLRAKGFDAVSYDPLLDAAAPPPRAFDLIVCIEVIEHLPDPVAALGAMLGHLAPGGVVLLSTAILPEDVATTRLSWWYIAPRNGHISIFSLPALAALFGKFGFKGGTLGSAWHLACAGEPPEFARHLFARAGHAAG